MSIIRKFYILVTSLSVNVPAGTDLCIQGSFHHWFHSSVVQWLDIAWYKAMHRIKKAVKLDSLKPVDDYVKFTSSAVDTAHVFHQVGLMSFVINGCFCINMIVMFIYFIQLLDTSVLEPTCMA